MQKFLKFDKNKKKSGMTLDSKGPTDSSDGEIVDHGTIGEPPLNYEIFKRGVIRITDGTLVFKKDINIFEEELKKINFENASEGEEFLIKGSGDNDNLHFLRSSGDIQISLKKRGFQAIEMLHSILKKGKTLSAKGN